MCKTKMATNAASPTRSQKRATQSPRTPSSSSRPTVRPNSFSDKPTTSYSSTSSAPYSGSTGYRLSTDTSLSSFSSLTSLRGKLPENPHIYDFSEIRLATNNFLAKRHSNSSYTPCWRCTLRGADVIIFQRKFRRKLQPDQLQQLLSLVCRSHHVSIVKLLGASVSGDHIYLVYHFVSGATLADCLRNKNNAHFTVLSTWISRMQVAADLAHGLDYIHNKTGLNIHFVHNHIKSTAIIITEPSFNARVCHFAAAQLCGEIDLHLDDISEISTSSPARSKQFEGVREYMAPEFKSSGVATQKSDVYAFGVVMLELLSGEEPLKFKFDEKTRQFVKTSVIETARDAVDGGEGELRRWVDRRLNDSFPVDVAERLTRVALECVHMDPDKRPDMARVVGKISKLYLTSKIWSDNIQMPDITVTIGPR